MILPRPNAYFAALALVASSGCVADGMGDDGAGGVDAGEAGGVDAGDVDCSEPAIPPSWLGTTQEDIVARLSGLRELRPGLTLIDRAGATRRQAVADYLTSELDAMGLTAQQQVYGTGTNVYAELEGSGSGLYVLGAHYDSVFMSPGANDNATGVAAAMATARFLSELPCRESSVIVVLFDEEEDGLIGSSAFAQELDSQGRDVRGVYTVDQVGWDMDGDRRLEIEAPGVGMLAVIQAAIDSHGLGVPVVETATLSSDHNAFRNRGFLAAGITEEFVNGDTTPYYHMFSDTYGTVDFDYLASSTTVLQALFSDLATGR